MEIQKHDPEEAKRVTETLDLLGYLQLRYGHLDVAGDYFALLVEMHPRESRYLRALAMCKHGLGEYEEALKLARSSLTYAKTDEQRKACFLILICILRALGQDGEAEVIAQQYLVIRRKEIKQHAEHAH